MSGKVKLLLFGSLKDRFGYSEKLMEANDLQGLKQILEAFAPDFKRNQPSRVAAGRGWTEKPPS